MYTMENHNSVLGIREYPLNIISFLWGVLHCTLRGLVWLSWFLIWIHQMHGFWHPFRNIMWILLFWKSMVFLIFKIMVLETPKKTKKKKSILYLFIIYYLFWNPSQHPPWGLPMGKIMVGPCIGGHIESPTQWENYMVQSWCRAPITQWRKYGGHAMMEIIVWSTQWWNHELAHPLMEMTLGCPHNDIKHWPTEGWKWHGC